MPRLALPRLTGPFPTRPNPAQPDRATAHFLWRTLLFMLTPLNYLIHTRPNLAIPRQDLPRQAAPHWHIANLIVHVSPLLFNPYLT